ncbi:MAG: Uma2 family endonuclease [Anaerolineae bacterium]
MAMTQAQPSKKVGMPFEEFMRLQEEQPFELLLGERVDKMPNVWIHSWMIRVMFRALDRFVIEHQLGEVFQETTYAEIVDQSAWIKGARIPDVMFFSAGRLGKYLSEIQRAHDLPFGIAPDLTVEVLSPSEKAVDINRKVKVDQGLGVRLIWIADPFQKTVTEYALSGAIKQLGLEDALEGADVLPGFKLPLAELFQEPTF